MFIVLTEIQKKAPVRLQKKDTDQKSKSYTKEELEDMEKQLHEVIERTMAEYTSTVDDVRTRYEGMLSEMVDDYRAVKRALKCANCSSSDGCAGKARFEGFSK